MNFLVNLGTDLVQNRYEEVEARLKNGVKLAHPLDQPGLLLGHEHHPHVHWRSTPFVPLG